MMTEIHPNWRDYSVHVCSIEIPQILNRPPKVYEICRSHLRDNAYIVVVDGHPEVVDQMDIWMTIKEISLELFSAFGIYTPEIDWPKRIPEEFRLAIDGDGNVEEESE